MKTRIFLLFLSVTFSGCSLIYSYSDNVPERINQLVSENKFNTALDTIDYIKPNHKNYRSLQHKKNLILKQMLAYEKKAISKSIEFIEHGEWIKAINLLEEVESNITSIKSIRAHKNTILLKRKKVISSYENEVLTKQAKNISDNIPLYKKINKTVEKNEYNELYIDEFEVSINNISLRLINRAENKYTNKNYADALTAINLSLKLSPNKNIIQQLNDLKEDIKKAVVKKKPEYIKEIKTLLSKLSQGYSHDVLNETNEKINWLDKIKADDKDYVNLSKQLKKHFTSGIKQHFEAARKLYSKGKTQEALIIWRGLKKLEPENAKLQLHISRAEKILKKLKKLSKKPKK